MKLARLTAGMLSLCLLLAACSLAAAEETEKGFKAIFDGKTLKGWEGNPKLWSVKDGTISGQTTKENPTRGNTFIIWRESDVADFELRLDFRIVGGNSGIQYRSKEIRKWVIAGYQADFDAPGGWTGSLYSEANGRGMLAKRGNKVVIGADGKKQNVGTTTPEKDIVATVKKEGWNSYTIIAKGNHLIQKVNGKVTIDLVDNDEKRRTMKGLLALQLHAGPPMLVQFKNIRIKMLDK